jgi:carboxymethylenebutenolidase
MTVLRTSKLDLQVQGLALQASVVQPDDNANYPGVVLVQEWWGMEPHILGVAQRLAAEGFVVAVPDLYHGKVATEPSEASVLIQGLRGNVDKAANEIMSTLDAVKSLQHVEPKRLGLVGFCVGGFLAYTVASRSADLGAIASFYGSGYDPTPAELANVNAPILAFYGKHDQTIPHTQIQKIEQAYKQAGKDLTVKIFDAGHAFMNPAHGMGNEQAAKQAWPLLVSFLKEKLR